MLALEAEESEERYTGEGEASGLGGGRQWLVSNAWTYDDAEAWVRGKKCRVDFDVRVNIG